MNTGSMFSEMKQKVSKAAGKATSQASTAAGTAGTALRYGVGATKAKLLATKHYGAALLKTTGNGTKATPSTPTQQDVWTVEQLTELDGALKELESAEGTLQKAADQNAKSEMRIQRAKRAAAAEAAERRLLEARVRKGGTMEDWRRAKQEKIRLEVERSQTIARARAAQGVAESRADHEKTDHVESIDADEAEEEYEDEDLQRTLLLSLAQTQTQPEDSNSMSMFPSPRCCIPVDDPQCDLLAEVSPRPDGSNSSSEEPSQAPSQAPEKASRSAWFLLPSAGTWLLPAHLNVAPRVATVGDTVDLKTRNDIPSDMSDTAREVDTIVPSKIALPTSPSRQGAVRCGA